MSDELLTEEMLDAIEAREKAAEAGPWTVVFKPDERPTVYTAAHFRVARCESWAHDHANVVFIAAARTDVPALVADDRRLRAEVERLRAENARLVARCMGRSTPPTTAEARAVHSAGGVFVRTPFATGRRFPDVVSGLARLGSDEADGRLKPATWLVVAPDGTVGDWPVLAAKAPRKPTRKSTEEPRR